MGLVDASGLGEKEGGSGIEILGIGGFERCCTCGPVGGTGADIAELLGEGTDAWGAV